MTVALVMGNMIGSGIFLVPASLAPFGGLSLAGWLVSTAGALLLAAVFAHLARLDPAAGGPYAYTRRAFGDVPAFLVAWGYWISMWVSLGALAVAFTGYLGSVVPVLTRTPAAAAITSIAAVWVLIAVNVAGVRSAGWVQVVTTILKIAPLVAIALVGLTHFEPSHFAVADTSPRAMAAAISGGATLTLWAFLGLESATVPAEQHRGRGQDHPARDDPRHGPDRDRLHREHGRRHEPRRAVSTGTVPGALRGGGADRVGWRGRDRRRAGREHLRVWRAERLGASRRTAAAGGRARRPVPARLRADVDARARPPRAC